MEIKNLVNLAKECKASDLHLSSGLAPIVRIDGILEQLDLPPIDRDELRQMMMDLLTDKQQKLFKEKLELDFALQLGTCRLRINLFTQARGIAAVFRLIPERINTLEELGFPAIFKELTNYSQGLVLVTGPTGSGKSTTLTSLIAHINNYQSKHIVSLEDPIEFMHKSEKSLIHQREIYRDTHSFKAALSAVLREDPDIILLGELRDYETIRHALTAAETGHLVFATLHTASAVASINRIIDVFPGEEKALIRSLLAESLKAVISQTLVQKREGGRAAAFEILIANSAIKNLIREDKIEQIYSLMQIGQKSGMQTLDQALGKLVSQGLIEGEEVLT